MGATTIQIAGGAVTTVRELGVGNLGSSIFRSVHDINSEMELSGSAPAATN